MKTNCRHFTLLDLQGLIKWKKTFAILRTSPPHPIQSGSPNHYYLISLPVVFLTYFIGMAFMIANGFAYLSHFSNVFEVQIWECSAQVILQKECARKIDTSMKDESTCLVFPRSPILDSILTTTKNSSRSCPHDSKGMSTFYFLMYF